MFFALFAMVSFTACSSSDDDGDGTKELTTENVKTGIQGLWKITHVSGYVQDWNYDEDDVHPIKVDKDVSDDTEGADHMLFSSDGTGVRYSYYDNSWNPGGDLGYFGAEVAEFAYDVANSKILVYDYYNGERLDLAQTYTILSLKDDAMVLQYSIKDGYEATITCQRINNK